jgi:hypothetical protein
LRTAPTLLLALALLGCSRHEAAPEAAGAPPSAPASLAPVIASPAPSLDPSASPVTPEDAEDDAARRITEQNLESELDRLEREIQAE